MHKNCNFMTWHHVFVTPHTQLFHGKSNSAAKTTRNAKSPLNVSATFSPVGSNISLENSCNGSATTTR